MSETTTATETTTNANFEGEPDPLEVKDLRDHLMRTTTKKRLATELAWMYLLKKDRRRVVK